MSGNNVDNRVVNMNFNNDQFEKGIDTSLKSIDKLKKGLDFKDASKSLDNLASAGHRFSLGNMQEKVSAVAQKFTLLEGIASVALGSIVSQALQSGLSIVESLTLKPAEMGFQEYETQMNAIQTILANTSADGTVLKNVTDALDVLNEYSDKTIYNFTEMTKNIGTFTAAGVKLNVAVDAIKGIANLAAISGSNAQQASTAMYQLSQAMAAGTVKLQDWNSVVNAGMGGQIFKDALMETARVHGIAIDQMVEKEGGFRNTLEKGWLSTDILVETLSKFTGDLNAEQLKSMGYTEDQIKEIIRLGKMANEAATKVKTFTQLWDTLGEASQSGWTKTWQIIIGDFDEAKVLMTEINDILGAMIGNASDTRNTMLQAWKDLGGRRVLINSIRQAFEGVLSIIKPIGEALKEIFPPTTGKQLYALTKGLEMLAYRLKIGEGPAKEIKSIFKGLFSLIDIGRMAIVALAKSLSGLGGPLGKSSKGLLTFLASGGDWITKLRDQIKTTDAFGKALDRLKVFLQDSGKKFETFVNTIKRKFTEVKPFLDGLGENIKLFFSSLRSGFKSLSKIDAKGLTSFLDRLKERFGPLTSLGQLIWKMFEIAGKALFIFQALAIKALPFIFNLSNKAADGINGFLDTMVKNVENFDFNKFFDILNGGLLAALLLAVRNFVQNGGSFIQGLTGIVGENGFLTKITDIFDGVRGSLEAYQKNLQSGMLLKIATAIGILAVSLVAISMIDSKRLAAALTAMSIMFIQLGIALAVLDKVMASTNITDMGAMTIGLLGLASAIVILSAAVLILGRMKTSELGKGLLAVGLLVTALVTSTTILAKTSGQLVATGVGLVIFAGALTILVGAVERLAKLDAGALTRGLIGIGVLCTELVLFMKSTNMDGMAVIKSVGILILAGALNVLAGAVAKLAAIDGDKLLRGLISVGVILAEVSIFVNSTGNAAQVITTAVALTILSGAMLILSKVMTTLGKLSWEEIGKGLVAMGGALLVIGIAASLLPKDLLVTAASLVVVASALLILSSAMKTMGSMSWEEVGKSLVTLGGSLLVLSIGLRAMSGTIAGVGALTLAAISLGILAPALKLMGSMDIAAIGGSLLLLAGVFTVFGIAALLLSETIPVILALAAAMAIIGLAVFLLGAGVAAAGVAIFSLAAAMTAASVAGTAGITMLLFAITGIAGLIPMIVTQLGLGILALLKVLVDGFPLILQAIGILLMGLIDLLTKIAPPLAKATWELLNSVLKTIAANLPSIIESGVSIIMSLLKGIDQNIGQITTKAYDIMIHFLAALQLKLPDLVEAGYTFIIALITGITEAVDAHMPELMVAVTKLSLAIIEGLLKGWLDSSAAIRQGMLDIAMVALKAIKDALGIHSPSTVLTKIGVNTLLGFINGIKSKVSALILLLTTTITKSVTIITNAIPRFLNAGMSLLRALISGISNLRSKLTEKVHELIEASLIRINSKYEEFKTSGSKLLDGLITGAESLRDKIKETAGSLIDDAKTKINDKVGEFTEIGRNVVEGFKNGIRDYIYQAVEAAMDLAQAVLDAIAGVLDINSPSGETEDHAMYMVLGMVGGFKKYGDLAVNAAKDMGKKTLSGLSGVLSTISDSVDMSLNSSPTIKPIIDLSNIEKGGVKLNSLLGTRNIDVSASVNKSNDISSRINSTSTTPSTSDISQKASKSGDITFIQHNTSPKALTPSEIYRQTKNQLSALKKQVGIS